LQLQRPSARSSTSSNGLYFLNSFTWSKALGDSEQALETTSAAGTPGGPQNIYNLQAGRGHLLRRHLHQRHQHRLPASFGKGRKFARGGAGSDAARRWELNTITATPACRSTQYTPAATNDVTGRILITRRSDHAPNLTGNPLGLKSGDPLSHYFDATAFQIPELPRPSETSAATLSAHRV
jgi:hypothetical protein